MLHAVALREFMFLVCFGSQKCKMHCNFSCIIPQSFAWSVSFCWLYHQFKHILKLIEGRRAECRGHCYLSWLQGIPSIKTNHIVQVKLRLKSNMCSLHENITNIKFMSVGGNHFNVVQTVSLTERCFQLLSTINPNQRRSKKNHLLETFFIPILFGGGAPNLFYVIKINKLCFSETKFEWN